MFNNLKLRGKMLFGYSVPVALIAGLAIGVYTTSQIVDKSFEHALVANDRARVSDALELRVSQIARQSRGYALTLDKELLDRYESGVKNLNEVQDKALVLVKDALPEQKERMNKMVAFTDQYEKITRSQIEAAKAGNRKLVVDNVEQGAELLKSFETVMKEFDTRQAEVIKNAENTTKNALGLLVTMSVLGALASLVIALIVAFVISSAIANTLNQAASEIASSSAQIASAVEEQERTVSQQASSVNETSTTMGELGTSSRQSAEQAEVSASGARHALSLTESGTKAVRQTLDEMTTLKDKVGAIAEQILRLSEQTNQIGNISGLVGDLANQTNMLALNAAVEAARAGDHGKGFAVVAEEIRKLADQSKKSAEKINTLVSDIQTAINSTVMVTDEGNKTVNEGLSLARSMAEAFTGVSDSINNVFISSQQISLNAKQQAVAINQVVEAMNAINLGSRETASGVSQIKVSTHQLNAAAQKLQAVV
ncbi:methyl-accepting chemotaxis protein [Pseudanabaena sp. FACHB-1277]|jgi:methyl-accepting chemotaxis protein|uniref:Methyl-accepting chemotaxis protein n=1 Tax=Pseudanabaena cinerea FACHB-1277 TaxID=2949581 RepID=A0A926UU42_9CYAN|nr:methyl-accepting chemotaxis protein [Pseudanabaena cinerea]MBD2151361.1 methyl-accepting chemotaxis protein [Pseudanabaena cinerea FACHB-1277]